MSQVQISPNIINGERKTKRIGGNGKIEVSSTDTSSKSKPELEEESSSSSDNKQKKEFPPVQPPPAKIISKINQDDSSSVKKAKSTKKTEKSNVKKKSTRSSEEAAIEPAPQIVFGAGDDDTPQEEKKRRRKRSKEPKGSNSSKKSTKKRSKKTKNAADAQSFAPQISRSTERFDDSKSVAVKRRSGISSRGTPLESHKNQSGLSKSQFQFDSSSVRSSKSKKNDTLDDAYVTILTIPTEAPEPLPKSPTPKQNSTTKKTSNHLPLPLLPPANGHGDGLMPLETMAETIEPQTNVFAADKYDGASSKRKYGHDTDMSQPVAGWLKFQVPIVPKPDDDQYERQATKQFDISRLLHQAKSC